MKERLEKRALAWTFSTRDTPGRVVPFVLQAKQAPRVALSKTVSYSIAASQGHKCELCREPLLEFDIDHRVPFASGGPDELGNLRALCVSCHAKLTRGDAKWMSLVRRMAKVAPSTTQGLCLDCKQIVSRRVEHRCPGFTEGHRQFAMLVEEVEGADEAKEAGTDSFEPWVVEEKLRREAREHAMDRFVTTLELFRYEPKARSRSPCSP